MGTDRDAAVRELNSNSFKNQPVMLVDISGVESDQAVDKMLEDAVEIANMQTISQKYMNIVNPYVRGNAEIARENLEKMSLPELREMLKIMQLQIHEEHKEVFDILMDRYEKMRETILPDDQDVLNETKQKLDSVKVDKIDSAGAVEDILEYRRAIVEEEDKTIKIAEEKIAKDVLPTLAETGPHALVVDVRMESGINIYPMLPILNKYLRADKSLRIGVITDKGSDLVLPKEIIHLTRTDVDETVLEMMQKALESRGEGILGENLLPANISIATGASMSSKIVSRLEGDNPANYLIASPDMVKFDDEATNRINRLIPTMLVRNLFERDKSENNVAQVIILEETEGKVSHFFKDVKCVLKVITRINISQVMRNFMTQLEAVSTAV